MPADRSALLSFHLGPVQAFVAAAKTTRDLWTGSYLLSWLTAAALKPVLETPDAEVLSPHLPGNPVAAACLRGSPAAERIGPPATDDPLVACLPNRFLARVPADRADKLRVDVEAAFKQAWEEVGRDVHDQINPALARLHHDWAALWQSQLAAHFEVRTAVSDGATGATEEELKQAGRLMAAARAVRHVPPSTPDPTADVPQKCTLLGTYEQMGPAKLDDSRAFWEAVRDATRTSGAAVRGGERLCAVSLVKRFAWAAHFAEKLDRAPGDLPFADTATAAAREWLTLGDGLPWEKWLSRGEWSGQWLHWQSRTQDGDDEECPEHVWRAIQKHKHEHGPPPGYYAVLELDADEQGKRWRKDPARVGAKLAEFALKAVKSMVEAHHGELVYTGGDNTLAVAPAERAVQLAHALNEKFALVTGGTLSAGVAVVHYKEDLRYALGQARDAGRAAKNAGRNRLALAVCRRSGEHTLTAVGWPVAPPLQALVAMFRGKDNTEPATDRWAYKLRELTPTLAELPAVVFKAEMDRLLARTKRDDLKKTVNALYSPFVAACDPRRLVEEFVTVCQSASFLARGGER